MKRIPLRLSIDLTIVFIGLFTVALTFISGQIYLDLALKSQKRAVVQFVSLETESLLQNLKQQSTKFARSIQTNGKFRQALASENVENLEIAIADNFNQYFVTAGVLDLVEVRLLRPDYQLLAHASTPFNNRLEPEVSLCEGLIQKAEIRGRTESLKPISDMCVRSGNPYHSMVLPVGLKPSAYLEIVTNPSHALKPMQSALGLGLSIHSGVNVSQFQSDNWEHIDQDGYSITAEYILARDDGSPILKIRARQRVKDFYTELYNLRFAVMVAAALSTIILFFVIRSVLSKLVVTPLKTLTAQLQNPGEHATIAEPKVPHELAELGELYHALEDMAMTDRLTSLPNRHKFDRSLKRALDSVKADGTTHVLCFCDLDQFKIVNDTGGHEAGDELLCQISRLLKNHIEETDFVARLGGDEFGLIMHNCDLNKAATVANAIRKAIHEYRFIWHSDVFAVGISIGLVAITEKSGSASEILRAADSSLYTAKDMGRNLIHVYTDSDEKISAHRDQMNRTSGITDALSTDSFFLMYQTIQPTKAKNVSPHCELLVRMLEEDGTVLTPDRFIPAAERYGIMPSVDKWVIANAFKWFASHSEALKQYEHICLNLSGQSIQQSSFITFVENQFIETGMPPEQVCFEITETAAITNINQARTFIDAGKRLGCHFALDDFGAAMCSFGYLKTLKVDYLKIDGSIVKNLVSDPVDREMVRHIHEIGSMLGMKTVVEFVENTDVEQQVRDIGVDYMQGWHVGHPMLLENMLHKPKAA